MNEQEKIVCQICNLSCNNLISLAKHLKKHKISAKDYYDNYLKKSETDGVCCICSDQTSFYNLTKGYLKHCSRKCMSNDNLIRDKIKKTCLDKYGNENIFQNKEIKQKSKNSILKKFGVDNISKSNKIKQLKKETLFNNYGVDNPSKSEIIQNKKINTSLVKYGTKNPNQSDVVKQRLKNSFLKKYGVDHWTKSEFGRYKSRILLTNRLENQKKFGYQNNIIMGKYESDCLNKLENSTEYKIIRCPLFIGYYPDGYIKELNLLIEYDEPHHFMNEKAIFRDNKRQRELKNYLKCSFFRIKHSDWIINENEIISKFKLYITNLKQRINDGNRT